MVTAAMDADEPSISSFSSFLKEILVPRSQSQN